MRKQRDGSGRARNDADAGTQGKRRKSSRARHGATSQPKLTGKRRRGATTAAAVPETQVVAAGPLPAEVGVAPVVSADAAIAMVVPVCDLAIAAVSPGDDGEEPADAVRTPLVPVPNAGFEPKVQSAAPAVALGIARNPSRSHRTRSSVLRWAAAAAMSAVCLLGLARLSDTQVSAYAVPSASNAALAAHLIDPVSQPALSPLQVAALVSPPASVPLVAPPDADPTSQNLTAAIAPSPNEHVLARDGTPAPRTAKLRQPSRKPVATETAAAPPPAEPAQAQAQLTGREHALGRYEMRWGTARLHEDPNADSAQGPSWDFVASAGER